MGNFPIRPLIAGQKFKRGATAGKIVFGVEGKIRPQGVASEEPGKAGSLAIAGRTVAGHQACSKEWISDHPLRHADSCPVVSLFQLAVRKVKRDGASEILAVEVSRIA